MSEISNARIESTMLGYEDHGIFTFILYLDYGGTHQGAGMLALDEPCKNDEGKFIGRFATAAGMQMIVDILHTVDVRKWEDLPGKYVRVCRGDGWAGTVTHIGHPLKDQWVRVDQLSAEG